MKLFVGLLVCFCLLASTTAQTLTSGDGALSRPYRGGTWEYKESEQSRLSTSPRVLHGVYLGLVDDDHTSSKPTLSASDLAAFWIAESAVSEAFARVNKSVTLTPVGTFLRQGVTIENARYDFLVLGGGSLLQKSPTYRALLFSNSRGSRLPPPVLVFGTGFDDDAELLPADAVEKIRARVAADKDKDAAVTAEPLHSVEKFTLPPVYNRQLKTAAAIPNAYGGARGVFTAALCRAAYSQSAAGKVLGEPLLLANRYLNTAPRTGLPRTDKPVVVITPGAEPVAYGGGGADELVKIMALFAFQMMKNGYYVVVAPLHTQDLVVATNIVKYINVVATNKPGEVNVRTAFCLNDCSHVVDMSQYLLYLKIARALVSYRLRGMAAAVSVGTPFVGVAYRVKHYDFAETYGLAEFLVRADELTGAGQLIDRLAAIETHRPAVLNKLRQIATVTDAMYAKELDTFAAAVVDDSRYEDQWETISQSLVGYPPLFQSWNVMPTHHNVIFIACVSANLPGSPGVVDRLTLAIQSAEAQFTSRRARQLVIVTTQLAPDAIDIIAKAVDNRVAELEFVFTSPRSPHRDVHTWLLEHRPWYENATFYFADVLYESHKQSRLWEEQAALRADPSTANLMLPIFVAGRWSPFLNFIREQEEYPYPRISTAQAEEIQLRIKQLVAMQQAQSNAVQQEINEPSSVVMPEIFD